MVLRRLNWLFFLPPKSSHGSNRGHLYESKNGHENLFSFFALTSSSSSIRKSFLMRRRNISHLSKPENRNTKTNDLQVRQLWHTMKSVSGDSPKVLQEAIWSAEKHFFPVRLVSFPISTRHGSRTTSVPE